MPSPGFSLGSVKNLEDAERALRDVEQFLSSLFQDDAPASGVVILVRNSVGALEQYTLVSTGGCTITQDAVNKRFTISVP